MKRGSIGWFATLFVFVAAVAGVAIWMTRPPADPAEPAVELPSNIPDSWREVRTSIGHVGHRSKGVACRECHGRGSFKRPPALICRGCHEKTSVIIHQTPASRDASECLTCHAFAIKAQRTCADCHTTAGISAGALTVARHATADCATCHRPHQDPPSTASGCLECHAEQKPGADRHQCEQCHDIHAETKPRGCTDDCHRDVTRSATFRGHDCQGCHKPHQFARAEATRCASCHRNKRALAAERVRQHRRCESCHRPHDPTRAKAACERCHNGIPRSHPVTARVGRCVDCHPAHPKRGSATVVGCSSCHSKAQVGSSAHVKQNGCLSCHPAHKGKMKQPKPCAQCHGKQAKESVKHERCVACHQGAGHKPAAAPKPCADCHSAERASAPRGHRQCQDCHTAHTGALEKRCADCHSKQTGGPHASVSGGCKSCHRAHGPGGRSKAPPCASCHTETPPGLHANRGHASCVDCHRVHQSAPSRSRQSCARCHTGLEQHEPDAKVCTGCHVFAK